MIQNLLNIIKLIKRKNLQYAEEEVNELKSFTQDQNILLALDDVSNLLKKIRESNL